MRSEGTREGGPTATFAWRPRAFPASDDDARAALDGLRRSGAVVHEHDTLDRQLRELVVSRRPRLAGDDAGIRAAVREAYGGPAPPTLGTWFFYPWRSTLVRVLDEADFIELRSDRNRYKITVDEQRRLAAARVGVVGLSVGASIAHTLALEGVARHFRLADPDVLDLSNLNRLSAGVADLGVNKAVLAARAMLELDPYLEVEVLPGGVSPDEPASFLEHGGRLDLLIEECDDLYVKVGIREEARRLGIPVLMHTSERGMLDVERFDLDGERPLFHGRIEGLSRERLRGLDARGKIPYALGIVGEESLSTRMAASLVEVGTTICAWPQLASSVQIGGGVAADVARRLLLGQLTASGRWYVDPEALITDTDGRRESTRAAELRAEPVLHASTSARGEPRSAAAGADGLGQRAGRPRTERAPSRAEIETIVAAGTQAPSAGNMQPWRFEYRDGVVRCLRAPAHAPFLDFEGGATALAIGAAVENMALAAAELGLSATFVPHRKGDSARGPQVHDHMGDLVLSRADGAAADPLHARIYERACNRHFESTAPVAGEARTALERAATERGATLVITRSRESVEAMAEAMGAADRLTLLHHKAHEEIMSEIRWSAGEANARRDGLDLETFDLPASDRMGLRIIANGGAMRILRRLGAGATLGDLARRWGRGADALALLTCPGVGTESYLQGGRALQRVWLTATALGVAVHPMASVPYLVARLERGGGEGLSAGEQRELCAVRDTLRAVFGTPPDTADVMLLRLLHAPKVRARSVRYPVSAVLRFL